MITYKDLLMLKLSETTQWNGKEMIIPSSIMKKWAGSIFTCEFVDLTNRTYTLCGHYENGVKCWQHKYKNGKPHGQSIVWYKSGAKYQQAGYKNGLRHGLSIKWYENGAKSWQCKYQNGILVKVIKND